MKNSYISLFGLPFLLLVGCASSPIVKSQAFARLKSERTFEYEFPVVWKAIESSLQNYKINGRDPDSVDALELKKISKRKIDTDWIFSESRDKYQEYTSNGFPKKKYLEIRIKYKIQADRVIDGTHVKVEPTEEVERLKPDGSSAGYSASESPDSSRADEMLEKIRMAILAAAP